MNASSVQASSFTQAEAEAMRHALEAALEGPRSANPLVGAALLDARGEILHVGRHLGAGTPHAEADVLAQAARAGTDLRDTTIVVTLEPCDHTGRTEPCSQAILEAGIPRAIFAVEDTQAGAGGARRLRAAGVQVRSGLLAEQSRALNSRWSRAGQESRPFVTAKIAQSLDGRIAAADGTSQWITGEQARGSGHALRARVDAIAVGTGTALADDPRLSARRDDGSAVVSQPLRVVIGHRDLTAEAAVRGDDGRFLQLRTHDPREALRELRARGVGHLLLEGGAGLISAFLDADAVDQLIVHQAPIILGGGRPSVELPGRTSLSQALGFEPDPADGGPVRMLGRDLLWRLQPTQQPAAAAADSTAADTLMDGSG
ncbi:bifunctional diaminohydroxyphosphoribosylaminopyrimidine deaminase/5-amino-6-(5-phosphoribosylamino)uracil reductase RibD [Kocuria sp. p3-SID1433]|uniref:bifunctional diaminohydroxyphosphoribosylaminopyrimidine deaminase/5-amino-6-(5-phosphoribosylamino)uracil reductase RibD n=1 Tax=unclassified Kocuria TaxID=2649579 RepID=UPI0021A63638|nr:MULTISPECIES: bifunctional diaminohydroxyphosphoribosylaminopyrimidine deaminase/5-amino-6-(5-phosphoribosylamino)uracil reductase RibD [unclassified Kocuria]MCT1602684.1 bifunctional diaminohydroxyphosphoribosylaminopyrimidine deaminase/5-amino-6-(5-phosphoribosylamino)uracil reductase RibD [Kocuria sp. p3-SID1428]MCT2180691.1 bifunctional diaminohydroxyphosphoribosylaminopyrimidine deaminase/5-amino-6-(5-phosphoribosylamino)uracil reductase RibD [Kocuria sp. p3-SID1433]